MKGKNDVLLMKKNRIIMQHIVSAKQQENLIAKIHRDHRDEKEALIERYESKLEHEPVKYLEQLKYKDEKINNLLQRH